MRRFFVCGDGGLETLVTTLPRLLGFGAGAREAVVHPSGGDDAPAIGRALEAHRRVRLAPGVYTLARPVAVPSGRTLAGSGAEHTTLRIAHAARHALAVIAAADEAATVEGLALIAAPGSSPGQTAIAAAAGGRATFRALEVRGFGGGGIAFDGAGHVGIDRVDAHDVGGDAVAIRGAARVEVARLRIRGADGCGLRVSACGEVRLGEVEVEGAAVGIAVDAGTRRVIADAPAVTGCGEETRIDPGARVVVVRRGAGR